MLAQRVAATPDKDALGYPTADGGIGWLTWAEVGARADAIAAGLLGLGVAPEDRVAILCQHPGRVAARRLRRDERRRRHHHRLPDHRARTTPRSSCSDSESMVLIAEDAEQVAKLAGATLPHLRHVVRDRRHRRAGCRARPYP